MVQPIRVLVADNNLHAQVGLRALLATWPEVEVVGEAMNGEEALRLVAEREPNAVLMDLQMPVMDGLLAIRLIKDRWPAINVIVLTLNAWQKTAAIEAGADAFVIKEGDPGKLLVALGVIDPVRKA